MRFSVNYDVILRKTTNKSAMYPKKSEFKTMIDKACIQVKDVLFSLKILILHS